MYKGFFSIGAKILLNILKVISLLQGLCLIGNDEGRRPKTKSYKLGWKLYKIIIFSFLINRKISISKYNVL